jgi:hypothetical protein
MLLPFFLDRMPELFGRVLGRIVRWQPEGSPILLAIDESADPILKGAIFPGVISQLRHDSLHMPLSAIIKLDRSFEFRGQQLQWLLACPRFKGHGVYRLLFTWSVVHIFPLEGVEASAGPSWEQMIGIGLLKLDRGLKKEKRQLGNS